MGYRIQDTQEYRDWLQTQTEKSKFQIDKRLAMIKSDAYFGLHKDVGDNVWELKWTDGRRIYYAYIPEKKILLLLGGSKNGQSYDISQAKKILGKYCEKRRVGS